MGRSENSGAQLRHELIVETAGIFFMQVRAAHY
jgi:hypothetical protein